jgi:hypothetical protein
MNIREVLEIQWRKCCCPVDLTAKGVFEFGLDHGGPFLRYLQLVLHISDMRDKEKFVLTGWVILVAEGLRVFRVPVRQVAQDCLRKESGSIRMKAYPLIIGQKTNLDIRDFVQLTCWRCNNR